MFPAKEENVATPLSKIHASGESLIYRSGIKKKTCLGGIGRFRRQTRVFGLSHVHEYVYLLSRRLFFVWQSDLQFKRGIHIISICAPRGSKPMVLPTPTAFSSTGATGTQRNSPSPELCTHTHTHTPPPPPFMRGGARRCQKYRHAFRMTKTLPAFHPPQPPPLI